MTDTNILEKYLLIKSAALDSGLVENVKLALSEEQVVEFILNAKSREVYLIPVDMAIHTDDDYVKFDIIIVDKVNNEDDEEYILQSWSNAASLLRIISGKLNYQEDENVIIGTASMGISGFTNDKDMQNVVTMVSATLDLEFNVVPNITGTTTIPSESEPEPEIPEGDEILNESYINKNNTVSIGGDTRRVLYISGVAKFVKSNTAWAKYFLGAFQRTTGGDLIYEIRFRTSDVTQLDSRIMDFIADSGTRNLSINDGELLLSDGVNSPETIGLNMVNNTWYTVIVTMVTDDIKVYVDNVEQTLTTTSWTNNTHTNKNLRIAMDATELNFTDIDVDYFTVSEN